MRQTSSFRNWVTPDGTAGPTGEGGFRAEAERYHLYVAYICPWASRTLIARKLKGLDSVVSVSIVEPALTKQGWRFDDCPGATQDHVNGATYMHEIYAKAAPDFTGRATVPVEKELGDQPFLFADHPTESDIRLFVTLVRFDVAYHGLFKCNLRRLSDYANLRGFCGRMLDWPGIAETVNLDHIKRGYYSIESLNPTRIVPVGPDLKEIF